MNGDEERHQHIQPYRPALSSLCFCTRKIFSSPSLFSLQQKRNPKIAFNLYQELAIPHRHSSCASKPTWLRCPLVYPRSSSLISSPLIPLLLLLFLLLPSSLILHPIRVTFFFMLLHCSVFSLSFIKRKVVCFPASKKRNCAPVNYTDKSLQLGHMVFLPCISRGVGNLM